MLELEEVDRPLPKDHEVLLRVRASSLNRGDRYAMQGTPMPIRLVSGLFKPKKRGLGMDFAGDGSRSPAHQDLQAPHRAADRIAS